MWSRSLALRFLKPGHQIRNFSAANVASQESSGIDDFLSSVSTAPSSVVSDEKKNKQFFDSSEGFFQWLNKNEVKTIGDYIVAANAAVNVREEERYKVFKKMGKIANSMLPSLLAGAQKDEALLALRFILQINSKDDFLLNIIQKAMIEKDLKPEDFESLRFETLIQLVKFSNRFQLEPQVTQAIYKSIKSRLANELDKNSDLITLLTYGENENWLRMEEFAKKTEQMVVIMGLGEKCNFLRLMATQKQRDTRLLKTLATSISSSNEVLSVAQIVTVASSLAALSFYPTKLFRKISEDLPKNANVLHKWNDVLSLTDSLLRLRIGNEKIWSTIVRWAIQNEGQASVVELCRFVSALARLGIADGKPLAHALKPKLQLAKFKNPVTWLNIVYSLAYFQELEPVFVDSVLNKSFVDEIFSSSHEKHDRLRKAMTLLTINECAKWDLKSYDGPTVSKASFEQFGIKFDAESICQARDMKYRMHNTECEDVFLKYLFQIAPRETHCRASNVDESGILVDAYVLPEKDTGRVSSVNQWGTNKPRPLFFYGWMQTKQNTEARDETILSGMEQVGLRLMRLNGYQPVVVFRSDFDYCATDIDKLNMLREKIHKF